MSKMKRINHIIQGLMMIAAAALIYYDKDNGYSIVVGFLCIYLLVYGINQLLYYFSLAKYMVGGKMILLKAVIIICLGLQVAAISDLPNKMYVMMYLAAGLIFKGLVDVVMAIDIKKRKGSRWFIKLVQGLSAIIAPIIGLLNANSSNAVIYFFCFGLVTSAIARIAEALRKSAVVYVQ